MTWPSPSMPSYWRDSLQASPQASPPHASEVERGPLGVAGPKALIDPSPSLLALPPSHQDYSSRPRSPGARIACSPAPCLLTCFSEGAWGAAPSEFKLVMETHRRGSVTGTARHLGAFGPLTLRGQRDTPSLVLQVKYVPVPLTTGGGETSP